MDGLIDYIIFGFFVISIIKSYFKGGTSESISLMFSFIGLVFGGLFFKSDIRGMVIAGIIFSIFYFIGLYLSFRVKREGVMERISGLIMGIVKFFVFLTIVTAIALHLESIPQAFSNNILIKMILPYAQYLLGLNSLL
jgi:hypothetical protein